MIRIVTAAVVVSALAVSSLSHAAKISLGDDYHSGEELTQHGIQSHIFDDINLTEHQYQQVRDFMQQAQHGQPPVNASELEIIHHLATTGNFGENAVRVQAERMTDEQVTRRAEMTRVRNQIYRLLTPGQQAILNEKHQQ